MLLIASVCLLAVESGMQIGYSLVPITNTEANVTEFKAKEPNASFRFGELSDRRKCSHLVELLLNGLVKFVVLSQLHVSDVMLKLPFYVNK